MSNWPIIHPEAESERDRLSSTHRPVPLPAYDIKGSLIAPDHCKTALAGAVARVTFMLTHWHIESKDDGAASTNSFVANVQSIRVLVNPQSDSVSPKKRKTAPQDPNDALLNKKIKNLY